MKLPLRTLLTVLLLSKASVWSATPPVDPQPKTIQLTRTIGSQAVGVEPQGGHFAEVIPREAGTPSKDFDYTFSIYAKHQATSVLSIYATNQSLIPLEAPLARVQILHLDDGQTYRRVRVHMSRATDRALNIWAEDFRNHRLLGVQQIQESDLRNARLTEPAPGPHDQKLPEVASGPPASSAGLKQFIGYRNAGGIFSPILHRGDTPETTQRGSRFAYFCTAHPGQLTADIRLFAGDSPYIEKNRPFKHYIVSGITPNDRAKTGIKLALEVGDRGAIIPIATEIKTGKTLQVDPYPLSSAALERLKSVLGQDLPNAAENFPSLIPPIPPSS